MKQFYPKGAFNGSQAKHRPRYCLGSIISAVCVCVCVCMQTCSHVKTKQDTCSRYYKICKTSVHRSTHLCCSGIHLCFGEKTLFFFIFTIKYTSLMQLTLKISKLFSSGDPPGRSQVHQTQCPLIVIV